MVARLLWCLLGRYAWKNTQQGTEYTPVWRSAYRVSHLFEAQGQFDCFGVEEAEPVALYLMDIGLEDVQLFDDSRVRFVCFRADFDTVKSALTAAAITPLQRMVDVLTANDDVVVVSTTA